MIETAENIIVRLVLFMVVVATIAIWAVVGLVMWVPLLVRSTTVFAALIVHAAVSGGSPLHMRSHLDAAVRFYIDGFRLIWNSIYDPLPKPVAIDLNVVKVLVEICWVVIFWSVVAGVSSPERALTALDSAFVWLARLAPIGSLIGALLVALIIFALGIYAGLYLWRWPQDSARAGRSTK